MNRILDVRAVVQEILAIDLGVKTPIDRMKFIHHTAVDVHRARAAGQSFIVYADSEQRQRLRNRRLNLERLATLNDDRVQRLAGWRESAGKPEWSVLVCREIEGEELSRQNCTGEALASLADLLLRLHATPAPSDTVGGPTHALHEAAGFSAFSRALVSRLAQLPVQLSRVQRHCDEMQAYLETHAAAFDTAPRLIHGDIQRRNTIVSKRGIGLIDWEDLSGGDYAYDLGLLKFLLDSLRPRQSAAFLRDLARRYRAQFNDASIEIRLRYYLAFAGLVRAFFVAGETEAFRAGRAWRVRASYLHSEIQWRNPLRIDGEVAGAPAARNEDWALDLRQPVRGLYFLLAPKRIA